LDVLKDALAKITFSLVLASRLVSLRKAIRKSGVTSENSSDLSSSLPVGNSKLDGSLLPKLKNWSPIPDACKYSAARLEDAD
jgi:hypothetical protein